MKFNKVWAEHSELAQRKLSGVEGEESSEGVPAKSEITVAHDYQNFRRQAQNGGKGYLTAIESLRAGAARGGADYQRHDGAYQAGVGVWREANSSMTLSSLIGEAGSDAWSVMPTLREAGIALERLKRTRCRGVASAN